MKIGCGTVVFRKYALDEALKAIKDIGYEYIETQAISPWCPHVNVDRDDPVEFAKHVAEFGFKGITALWMPHGTIISDVKSVEYAKRCIEWSAAAGISVVNTGDGFKPDSVSDEAAFEILEERLYDILETAAIYKVYLAIEPHGTYSLNLKGLKKILSLSESPWLGINYDAANVHRACYVESGQDSFGWRHANIEEDETTVLKAVANRVVHFHAKDIRAGLCTALGEGEIKLAECIDILKRNGYGGVLSLETEGEEDMENAKILARKSLDYLKKYISKR